MEKLEHGTRVRLITDGSRVIATRLLGANIVGSIMHQTRQHSEGKTLMVFDEQFDPQGWPLGGLWVGRDQVTLLN